MIKVTLQERSDAIARKLASGCRLPLAEIMMNAGSRRTVDKRRLLQAIADMAAVQARAAPFKARF